MHLRLDALLKPTLAFGQQLRLDMRAQITRYRINGLVLLFDAEREGWAHDARLQMIDVTLRGPGSSSIWLPLSLRAFSSQWFSSRWSNQRTWLRACRRGMMTRQIHPLAFRRAAELSRPPFQRRRPRSSGSWLRPRSGHQHRGP